MPTIRLIFIILILTLSTIGIVSAAYFAFSGSFGSTHTRGVFHIDNSGNAGTTFFDGSAGLDGTSLVGDFTVETIGRVTFNPGVHIISPESGKVTDLWGVIGTASSLAGPIDLSHVQYDPVSKKLVGYGTNYGIGKISFGTTTGDMASITASGTSQGFEGRVKVLGTIGGNSAFANFYSPGTRFNASVYNSNLNQIRKNVALLVRNVDISNIPRAVNNTIFIRGDKKYSDIQFNFPVSGIDSLIMIGGDLIVDQDIINMDVIKPKGIIVMKDEMGAGGNIVVQGSVKKIQASLFAEASIYSGDSITSLYNDTSEKVLTLPENQLYIQGSLISRNTIGGATQSNALCIYGEVNCDFARAIRYDLNYLRLTPPSRTPIAPGTTSPTRSYGNDTTHLDAYSLIIERDPRISSDPPPGWEVR